MSLNKLSRPSRGPEGLLPLLQHHQVTGVMGTAPKTPRSTGPGLKSPKCTLGVAAKARLPVLQGEDNRPHFDGGRGGERKTLGIRCLGHRTTSPNNSLLSSLKMPSVSYQNSKFCMTNAFLPGTESRANSLAVPPSVKHRITTLRSTPKELKTGVQTKPGPSSQQQNSPKVETTRRSVR